MAADRTNRWRGGPLMDVSAVEAEPALFRLSGKQLSLLQQIRQGPEPISVGLFNGGDQLKGGGDFFKPLLSGNPVS